MRLVVGLGNPGSEYAATRHNIGWAVVDAVAETLHLALRRRKFDARYAEGNYQGEKVFLCEPQAFMNRSGEAVGSFCRYLEIDPGDLLVVHDDLDLELGALKFARDRGSAGHQGVASVIEQLGTRAFDRLRIGIGRPPKGADPVAYVLGRFDPIEEEAVRATVARAAEGVLGYLTHGLAWTMTRFHQKTS
ncbi:MAG: aminoacyl-tRNA hydrolase [Deltaproteobacteria bacterium]|nr:aminoacyl-tRNA hydrolase [Deltaproteobacteria bacterium]